MENTILYYNENSIDCKFASIIDNLLFKSDCYPVNDNLVNINEFEPIQNNQTKIYYFIGVKPSNNWLTQNQITSQIFILCDNLDISDYLNLQLNVNPILPTIYNIKSLSYIYLLHKSDLPDINIKRTENFEKLKSLLHYFENYINSYTGLLIDFRALSAYNTINSLCESSNSNNITNINNYINLSENLYNSDIGLIYSNYMKNYITKLFGKSTIKTIIFGLNNRKSLVINHENHKLIDRFLTNYLFENIILTNFVEYYTIQNNEVIVFIKKWNMFINPIEINNNLLLTQYIGIDNKADILDYINIRYQIDYQTNPELIKIKTDGTINFKTTTEKFFII